MTEKQSDCTVYVKPNAAEDESGIALLMSLGVLSLLIVLSLSFAVRTMNSMKGVQLSQDLVKVRLFDESGFQKTYALLSGNFADPNETDNLFPATKEDQKQYIGPKPHPGVFDSTSFNSSSWAGRAYWFSVKDDDQPAADTVGIDDALHLTILGKNFTPSTAFTTMITDIEPDNQFGWLHILDESQDYPDSDTPITARVSYLIVDESGKIDPWAVREPGVAEGSEVRRGQNVNEINLNDVVGATLSGKLSYESDSQKWSSHYNIYKTIQQTSTLSDAEVDSIQANLFPYSYDIEAFSEPMTVGETTSMANKHRFNLGQHPSSPDWWDTLTAPKIDALLQPASDFGSVNNGGIPWLSIPYSTLVGTDTDLVNQVAQIAANIIDYCDDDSNVGTDVSVATSDYDGTNIPTFCGNERVPYISEIKFRLTFTNPTSLELAAQAELINVFEGEALNVNGQLLVTVNVAGTDTDTIDNNLTFVWDPPSVFTTTPTGSADYYADLGMTVDQAIVSYDGSGTVNDITLTVVSALLRDDSGNLWDFAVAGTSPQIDPTGTHNITVEVDDPRNNLDSSQWSWTAHDPADTDGWDQGDSIGLVNEHFLLHDDVTIPLADKDDEPDGIEPWQVSTNFIRNGPMQSLWELGAIHRGGPWQTINLRRYSLGFIQQVDDQGLDDYASGDADILAQVKLGEDEEVTGRVNLNTYNSTVLASLFNGIMVGRDYNNGDLGSTATLGPTEAATLATQILANNGLNGGDPFHFRGEIVQDVTEFFDGSLVAQPNDRAQEEIIGKMITLTTTRQNYFTAIITSQIVKDMIDGYQGGSRGVFDDGVDEILAEQRLFVVLYRDALTNEFDIIRYEYLDQ